jgi:hypothetical protein
MGYEVVYYCHPKKEDGAGYDLEKIEEIKRKVGKPFDDSTLQDLANAIVAMMARRDKFVVDVKAYELVRNEVNFREAKDGKAIILKGKRFSLDGTVVPEPMEEQMEAQYVSAPSPQQQYPNGNAHNLQPHEMAQYKPQPAPPQPVGQLDNLYTQPNASLAPRSSFDMSKVNKNKVLYWVYFEPYMWKEQARNLRFTEDKKYAVHAVIPSATGRLDMQQIVVTDDTGNLIKIDEKFFTSAGGGLVGDDQGQFSGQSQGRRGHRKAKLMYEDEMSIESPVHNLPSHLQGIPLDNGQVPAELLKMPDFGRGVM